MSWWQSGINVFLHYCVYIALSHYFVCCPHNRSDSSFRFFVFFFIYICQFGVHVLQTIGITGWGTWWAVLCFYWFCVSVSMEWSPLTLTLFCPASGWIAALTGLNTSIPVGIIMLLIAALFTALSVGSLIMFKKVTQSQSTNMSASVFNVLQILICDARNKVELQQQ